MARSFGKWLATRCGATDTAYLPPGQWWRLVHVPGGSTYFVHEGEPSHPQMHAPLLVMTGATKRRASAASVESLRDAWRAAIAKAKITEG